MRLRKGDRVAAMDVVDPEGSLLILGRNGYGKLSMMRHYPTQKPNGLGVITLQVTSKTGPVAAAAVVGEEVRTSSDSEGALVLLTDRAQVLRTNLSEIRMTGRNAQGVRIQVPEAGDKIAAIRVVESRRAPEAEVDPSQLTNGNGAEDLETEPDDENSGEVEELTDEVEAGIVEGDEDGEAEDE